MSKKTLVLKNYQLQPLLNWLNEGALPGKQSRYRTRFTNLCLDRFKELEKTRLELLEKYTKKDKKGEVLFKKDKDGNVLEPKAYDIDEKGLEKYFKEYNDYLKEDFIIDVLKSNEETIQGIKDILLLTLDTFSNKQDKKTTLTANLYNEICEIFENIK